MVQELIVHDHPGPTWMQTIYQTTDLTLQNGRVPAAVIARQLHTSLDELAINHEIYWSFPTTVSVSTQQAVCGEPEGAAFRAASVRHSAVDPGQGRVGDPPFDGTATFTTEDALPEFVTFLNSDAPMVTKDSNLLVTAAPRGGGCAFVGGNAGVVGGHDITSDPGERVIRRRRGTDGGWGGNVSAALHEIGHNMGYAHEDAAGWAWNQTISPDPTLPASWHRTPYGPDIPIGESGYTNRCGETIGTRFGSDIVDELYYHDCVADTIEIQPDQTPPPGDDPNVGPVAQFGFSANGLAVSFDGSPSFDPDGIIQSYEWNFGDGTTATGAQVTHEFPNAGTFAVTLTVEDDQGETTSETRPVGVQEPSGPGIPEAAFDAAVDGLTVDVDGAPSSSPAGIVGYQWDWGDGATSAGATASHTYDLPATYFVRLTVTDGNGETATTVRGVTVTRPPGNGNGGNGGNGNGGNGGPPPGDGDDGGPIDIGRGEAVVAGGVLLALFFLARPDDPLSDD